MPCGGDRVSSLTPSQTHTTIATVIPPNNAKDMSDGNVEPASDAVQRTTSAERSSSNLNYRVRNIPARYSFAETKTVLKTALKLDRNSALWVGSVAPDLEKEGFQVATITFKGNSELLPAQDKENKRLDEWTVVLEASDDGEGRHPYDGKVTVDTHFRDFTPLNTPSEDKHAFDLIALCGLNGHAFGSFKQRGGEHMWLRDALPQERTLAGIRVVVYGYSAKMVGSRSFQGLEAIASTFKNRLKGLRRLPVRYE
jgi:hypothetical protein